MKIGGVLVSIQQNECCDKNDIKKNYFEAFKRID